MTDKEQAVLPPAEWLAESMRATCFPTPDAEGNDPSRWWYTLLDREPDTRVVRPGVGEWREEGEYAGGKLSLVINAAGVIQWTLSPTPVKQVPSEFPTVGRLIDAFEAFCPLVRRWFDLAPRLDRLAFGAVVLFPVPRRIDGYNLLARYLPAVRIDPENSSDLLYRINRRRRSRVGIEGLEINRLSAWSVAQLQVLVQPASEAKTQRALAALHACRVELDINTVSEYRGAFAAPRSSEVFDELVALAREILEYGDQP